MFNAIAYDNTGKDVFHRLGVESKFVATLLEHKAYKAGGTKFIVTDNTGNVVYSNTRAAYPFKV